MLLYVTIGSNDLFRSRLFYDAVLAELGYKRQRENIEEVGYAADGDIRCRLWVVTPFNRKAATIGNGSMVALEAPSRAAVDAFHRAGLGHGGTDEGLPGLRPFHADFYAAYLRDPDGNKISAVCERPE
ncbi:MAG: glyoxalase [Rhizobium sp. 63-7]|nr:MAG: glyoxalase [Rhizobium sp. 63-7]